MDYSRQRDVFQPELFKSPVHIIGCGATGSWLALTLAKLGVADLHLWDFDKVEEHNLPNQCYDHSDIGIAKAEALYSKILAATNCEVTPKTHIEAVTGDTKLAGIVFVLTDTMKSRDEIFKKALKYNIAVPLVIETRMGLESGIIYSINPSSKIHIDKYEKTLYTDEVAVTSMCGVSQSVAPTALIVANYAIWQFFRWFNKDEDTVQELIFDVRNNTTLTGRW